MLGVLSVSAFHGTAVDGFQYNLTWRDTAVLRQYATHLLATIPAARFIRKLAKPTLRNAPAGRDDGSAVNYYYHSLHRTPERTKYTEGLEAMDGGVLTVTNVALCPRFFVPRMFGVGVGCCAQQQVPVPSVN